MVKLDVELNSAGIQEVLKSADGLVKEHADEIAGRCGNGYESDVYIASTRAIASVYTATEEAKEDNAANNTILKALR